LLLLLLLLWLLRCYPQVLTRVQMVHASFREWDSTVNMEVFRPLCEAAFSNYAAQGQQNFELPTTKVCLIHVEPLQYWLQLEELPPCPTLVCEMDSHHVAFNPSWQLAQLSGSWLARFCMVALACGLQ
jgi:hypothetical protein